MNSRRPSRFAILVAIALFGVVPVSAPPTLALPGGKQPWVEVRSPRFAIFSNSVPASVRSLATRLERLTQVLERTAPWLEPPVRRPTYIYVFRDWKSSRDYLPRSVSQGRVGGVFLGHRDADYVVISDAPENDALALVYHEYLHSVVAANYPAAPLWAGEGLAEFFETFRANDYEATVAATLEGHRLLLRREPWIPTQRLFAATTASPEYRDAVLKPRFHAQAWLLVHYLMMERRSDHGSPLWDYLELLESGTPGDQALAALLPEGAGTLEVALRRYVEQPAPSLRIDVALQLEEVPLESRAMTRQDVLYRLGDLLAHRGRDHLRQAERHFRRAVEVDPQHVPAWGGLARSLMSRARELAGGGRPDAAIRLLRDSLDEEPWPPDMRRAFELRIEQVLRAR